MNAAVIREVKNAGYKAAFSTNFSRRNSTNVYSVNRIDVTGDDSMEGFINKLKPHSYYYYKQQVKNFYSRIKTM